MLITNISIALNFIFLIGGALAWFKVPDMLLEHYKSHLEKINQDKEHEFRQSTQENQQKFEEQLQSKLAEAERGFEQKAALLKKKREILPLIYSKLLELNGAIRSDQSLKKQAVQITVNNYIESNRLFLDEVLYKKIKDVQKSMSDLSAIYDTTPQIQGPTIDGYDQKSQKLEEAIERQLTDLETIFVGIMFDN
ncbi:hypothetical protein [Lactiplantibacillus pentosus]|uniref:hypothetical protein n=1 Tax=Lactiplantibacillus pentosus TaxID=1589 RepID=UPI001C1F7E7A|nr:hypothetical protein [Lactiplantibacillus pentosus]MBU7505074.1 hypothetical protein [Lactiplantibacillus pentosus]MDY1546578.1 hypothetical protein [Lactiplantibacillus pentosus]